jgi:heme a synthase
MSAITQPVAAANQDKSRAVRLWLYTVLLVLFALVVVGGATRLTDSGLSITEWRPIHGIIPPLSITEWQEELEKYRQIPEYQEINKGMTLEAFKVIYWWEWAHRFLARFVGLVFAVPLAVFWMMGRLEQKLKPRLLALLALGGFQGFIGWWMVSSGLTERTDVSQYRLATHLTLASIIFAGTMWVARGLAPHEGRKATSGTETGAMIMALLVLSQIYIGGLVAGLNAGYSFNTWPLIDGRFIPDQLLLLEPAWRNFFENPKTVQFIRVFPSLADNCSGRGRGYSCPPRCGFGRFDHLPGTHRHHHFGDAGSTRVGLDASGNGLDCAGFCSGALARRKRALCFCLIGSVLNSKICCRHLELTP